MFTRTDCLTPREEWILNHYDSITDVWKSVDKDGNHYISLYEDISWIKQMRAGEMDLQIERGWQNSPDTLFPRYENWKTTNNLEILSNIYLLEFSPSELKNLTP